MNFKAILQKKNSEHEYKFITIENRANALDAVNWILFNYADWDVTNLRLVVKGEQNYQKNALQCQLDKWHNIVHIDAHI